MENVNFTTTIDQLVQVHKTEKPVTLSSAVQQKKVIIIGATSGIGKGLAKLMAANNYYIGITGRREKNLFEMKSFNPESFVIKAMDVQDTHDALIKLEELIVEMGGVDTLIYCSGIGDKNLELDFNIEYNTILTNTVGFTNIATYMFNYFKKQGSGHIVCISSIAGFRGNPFYPAYAATKAYLMNYVESLRIKSKKENCGITVTDLRPGFVKTGHVDNSKMFWAITVDEAVKPMLKAIQKKKEVVYIKQRWWFISVIMKLIPRWVYNKLPF